MIDDLEIEDARLVAIGHLDFFTIKGHRFIRGFEPGFVVNLEPVDAQHHRIHARIDIAERVLGGKNRPLQPQFLC